MAKKITALKAPRGHVIPPLLDEFAAWLDRQEDWSVGYGEIAIGQPYWTGDKSDARLKRDGFVFMTTADDSQLVLMNTSSGGPPAVCLLGSEGATGTIANTLEEFLALLADGETGIPDLDTCEATRRRALKAWLAKKKVKAPRSVGFDFDAYLDGGSGAPVKAKPAAPAATQPFPETVANLPPLTRQVAIVMGRRADDPEMVSFVAGKLGRKLPQSVTETGRTYVVDKKHGLEMLFQHSILNEKYPLVHKSRTSFVPYLKLAWLNEGLGEELPFGLKFGMTKKELRGVLGTPVEKGEFPVWLIVLDPQREVVMDIREDGYMIKIAEARDVTPAFLNQTKSATGALVAWAALRGLLNESKFHGHEELLGRVCRREARGSALVDAALPRGLWDTHFKDKPGLRDATRSWVRNLGEGKAKGQYINTDFEKTLGSEEFPGDDWQTVNTLAPMLDKRFARWVRK